MPLSWNSPLQYMEGNEQETPEGTPEEQPSRIYAVGLMYGLSKLAEQIYDTKVRAIEYNHNFWRGYYDVCGVIEWKWEGGRSRMKTLATPRHLVPRVRLSCEIHVMNSFCDFLYADWQECHGKSWAALPTDFSRLDACRPVGRMDFSGRLARWVVDSVYHDPYVCVLPQREEIVREVQGWVED